jgi:diguanylate cyclase (GGDEF)-like protein
VTEIGLVRHIRIRRNFLMSGHAARTLSAIVVTVIFAFASFSIWQNHLLVLDERQQGMESMGVVLAEQTARYVQVFDLIVQEVTSRAAEMSIATPAEFADRLGTEEIRVDLAQRVKNVPQVDAIVLISADGRVLNTSRPGPVQQIDVTGREYFHYLKTYNDSGMFIGSPAKAAVSGKISLFFARRITGPDGAFLGLVLCVVDLQYLNDFYRSASEHLGQAVTLLRRDGTMLLRYPDPASAIGIKLPLGSPWYARVTEGGGNYITPGTVDHIPSLVSVHPLRDYPLVIDVLMDQAVALAPWRRQTAYTIAIAVSAALCISMLVQVLVRQFRSQVEHNAMLEEAATRLSEGQQMLRSFAEMSADWFWEQDAAIRFKFNPNIPFMIATDDTGKTRRDVADPAMSEERWTKHEADIASRVLFRNFRWERIGSDGNRRFLSTSGDPTFDRHGVFSGYRGTGRDITAEVEAAERLARANHDLELGRQQFDAVLSNITHGVCFFDGQRRLLLCNPRYAEIYNLPQEATSVGRSLEEIVTARYAAGSMPDTSPSDFLLSRVQVVAANQPARTVTALRNGRFIAINHQPMPNGGWVATHDDITEQKQAEASILFMARHDALTKLPNRALFHERMEQAIAMAGRGSPFAVLCLDLDKFKHINDTLGHPVGDGLLVAVAGRLRACVREIDTIARLGGDEFAIIQLAVHQPDDADVLAQRIIAAFGKPFDIGGHQVMSGVSIGAIAIWENAISYESVMRNADIALYLAKTEGRGTVRFFEPEMDARIHERRLLELELQGAVARNEFELYYQPQVSLIANKIIGFEALLRWRHPVRGLVSPIDFIPVAEETGTIVEIGEWVLRNACFEAENWPIDISVAVNLSPVQFKKHDLVTIVQAALDASGLNPDRLELEITESIFLRNSEDTLNALRRLRAMGVKIALDDFGTGYSSLSYLQSFPFSKIKIDKSFVSDLVTNRESMSIIRAVIGLGQSLNMTTIAEGVETREQLDKLRTKGCAEAQGYFFSRPRPANELPSLIASLQEIDGWASSAPIASSHLPASPQ